MDESDLEYLLTHCMGCHESLIDGRDLDSEGLPLYGCGVCVIGSAGIVTPVMEFALPMSVN